MPHIEPPGGEVDWPREEGTLGIVGVAPWATLDFLRAFYARVSATKDWHYPRVIADINTKLPSRGRHLELGETDPSPHIARTLTELAQQGATVIVVPCNTAHLLFDRWAAGSPVHVPHIVRETAAALAAAGARRVVSLGSSSLRRHGLYEHCLQEAGLQAQALHDAQALLVTQAIEDVKQRGSLDRCTQAQLQEMLLSLHRTGIDGVALGCTELASLVPLCQAAGLAVAESNDCLAAAALRRIQAT